MDAEETLKLGTPDETGGLDTEAMARREFLKKVGRAGATAPAVALLLAANVRSASGSVTQYGCAASGGGSGSICP